MKSYIKAFLFAAFAALLLPALDTRAALPSTRELPLHGTIETVETHIGAFPMFALEVSGVGHASLLGRFGLTMSGTLNLLTRTGAGTARIRAANGDLLFATVVGQATLTGNPNEASVVEILTITGGTGRFAEATGSIRMERIVDSVALVSAGTLEGVIVLPSPAAANAQAQ